MVKRHMDELEEASTQPQGDEDMADKKVQTRFGEYDNPFVDPDTGEYDVQPAQGEGKDGFGKQIADSLRRAARTGGMMSQGKQRTIRAVLTDPVAEELFAPYWGEDGWRAFRPLDPNVLRNLGPGKWRTEPNPEYDPDMVDALFGFFDLPSPNEGEDDRDPRYVKPQPPTRNIDEVFVDPNWTPEEAFEAVGVASMGGREMTDGQRRMVNFVINGAADKMLHGSRSGIDLFLRIYDKNLRDPETGEKYPNPDFRPERKAYADKLLGNSRPRPGGRRG